MKREKVTTAIRKLILEVAALCAAEKLTISDAMRIQDCVKHIVEMLDELQS